MILLLVACMAAISYTPLILDKKHLFTSFIWANIFLLISLLTLTTAAAGWVPVNAYTLHISYIAALLHAIAVVGCAGPAN
jgi:hypothetical protein